MITYNTQTKQYEIAKDSLETLILCSESNGMYLYMFYCSEVIRQCQNVKAFDGTCAIDNITVARRIGWSLSKLNRVKQELIKKELIEVIVERNKQFFAKWKIKVHGLTIK